MSVIKAIVGGLIGAVGATFILMVLRDGNMRGYEWFPVVTGLLTGLGVKLFSGSASGYATGAVAVLISMIAILVGDETVKLWNMRNLDYGPTVSADQVVAKIKTAADRARDSEGEPAGGEVDSQDADEAAESAGDAEDSASEDLDSERVAAGDGDADVAPLQEAPVIARGFTAGKTATTHPLAGLRWRDYLNYVCSGLGMLLAYQLGRGPSQAVTRAKSRADSGQPADENEVA